MADKIKVTGLVKEQEARTTQAGDKNFHTITVETDGGEVKCSDWSSLCKKAGIIGMTGIFVETQYIDGQYPRLVSIKQVEKPPGFVQNTLAPAAAKDAQSFMPAPPPYQARRPLDFATSQEYLAFKLAVDFTKDEQIEIGQKKLDRMIETQKRILVEWDKQKGVNT